MKLKFIILCAYLFLGQSAFAQSGGPFSVGANCSFNQATGKCAVYNSWNQPIYCSLKIRGMVMSGFWFDGYENVVVMPGQYAYAYVYSQNPRYDPLVKTFGSANCRF